MNEMVNTHTFTDDMLGTQDGAPGTKARLDQLAAEAHLFVQGAAMNILQLGRVLREAKPLIPHGEFDAWCREHAKMSRRTAEQYMQAYAQFGLNTRVAELGTSKIIKLLPMAEEDRERLLDENDVAGMSTRELDAAIRAQREQLRREARQEAEAEIERERKARIEAEKRAEEAERRPPEIPPELTDELAANRETIARQRAEVERLAAVGNEAMNERRRLSRENADLQREIRERDDLLAEQQEDLSRAQQELLNAKSAMAKGDAERAPADQLTPDAFARAVQAFIGTVARMPHMRMTFAAMPYEQKQEYSLLLETVEKWAEDSRKAIEATTVNGTVIYSE